MTCMESAHSLRNRRSGRLSGDHPLDLATNGPPLSITLRADINRSLRARMLHHRRENDLHMPSERDRLHFVGSIPSSSSEDVFRQLSTQVGQFLRRMPDGETGERTLWIKFQQKMLFEHPAMEPDPTHPPLPVRQADGTVHRHIQFLRLKPDADPNTVEFQTGYDQAAAASYGVFRELRDAHVVPAHMRLQVALPTPMATGLMYVSPAGRDRYLRAYERSLLKALRNIFRVIPHRDLSIQFDVCQEVLLFENYFPTREPNYKQPVFEQFGRLGAAVPNDVELGFHLCYGSPGDQPLLILKNAGVLAELMKGIGDYVRRPVEFIHIPIPKHATEAFFAPLRNWRWPEGTSLYLGLLQFNDEAGNRARIGAAQRVVDDFGVAAGCGFGRTDPSRMPTILASHRAAAQSLAEIR
jgi:hypothetical protein